MSGNSTEGRVYFERHHHILKVVIDNPSKKNAFSPEMMAQLSDAYTLLKRFPPDLNRRDSQRVKDERIFVH